MGDRARNLPEIVEALERALSANGGATSGHFEKVLAEPETPAPPELSA